MNKDDFTIDFDVPETKSVGSHFENVNKLSEEETQEIELDKETKFDNILNPYGLEYRVVLDKETSERFTYAVGLHSSSVAKVSKILSKNYVNISYWEVFPNVFKNVHISQLSLYERSPIKHKIKHFFSKLIRKLFFVK